MKISILLQRSFCTLALLSLGLTGMAAETAKPNPAQAAGTWKWIITIQDGQSFEASAALKQEADKLTGTYTGRLGEAPIEDGKVTGNTVAFKVTRKFDDQTFVIKYEGKLDGDRIKGSGAIGDGDQKFEWNAKREPSKIDPTGAWNWSMTRSNGDKTEATLKLKLEGQKLTGTVSNGDWSVDLENGQIQGNEISFQTTMERDGGKLIAKSKGKITGSTIKGKVEYTADGEARVRDWEAQKQ